MHLQQIAMQTMRDETFLEQIREVNELRAAIDATGPTFSPVKARADVAKIYGRSIGRTTWHRWKLKCGVTNNLLAEHNGNYPAGAYLLLMVNAKLSRGNGAKERSKKITRPMLVTAVKAHRRRSMAPSLQELPEYLAPTELIAYAEAKANRSYHPKTHQKRGIHRSKPCYSRAEAIEILAQYPSFAIGA